MIRLAIISTHPIQYNAPLFRILTERNKITIKVFYTWGEEVLETKFDPGFGRKIQWDVPLMEGYSYGFVNNISPQPGSHHFKGIDNPALIEEIETWQADAILIYGWNFKSHLRAMRYFHKKIPVIFRGDSTLLDRESSLKEIIKKLILNWVYRHVDMALYVGEENRKYFKYAGLKESQLVFAPHAIDNARFNYDADGGGGIRESLDIPNDSIVFLFAGKLESKKNPGLLLSAFIQLNHEHTHLIIAGNGPLEKTLKTCYRNHQRIHFITFQNQSRMPALYSACNIFVLPSQGPGETWGLSVNEAMACGRPVLVSDKCGCAVDLVQNDENGYIFESGNRVDLTRRMADLSKDKVKLQKMGATSLEIIAKWNYQNVCKALEELIIN